MWSHSLPDFPLQHLHMIKKFSAFFQMISLALASKRRSLVIERLYHEFV